MKKMMCILATAIAALVLTGCGGKPKIPANTVVACYVDLEKCLKNGNDIAELVIDNLPKHLKGKAEDAHEKAREEFEKNLSSFDFKWLAVTVGTDGKPSFSVMRTLAGLLPKPKKPLFGSSRTSMSTSSFILPRRTRPERTASSIVFPVVSMVLMLLIVLLFS